jgi:hypothetical protein
VGLLLSFFLPLSGCADSCSDAAIVGEYEVRSSADVFTLELHSASAGVLSKNGRSVGTFTWSLRTDDGSLLLDVPRAVGDSLREIRKSDRVPADIPEFTRETYVLHPACSRLGKAMRIPLSVDDDVSFERR